MGHKDTIKGVLRNAYGIKEGNFSFDLAVVNGQELIKTQNSQAVKARFNVDLDGLITARPPVIVDVYVTVWGSVMHSVVYNKLDKSHQKDLKTFLNKVCWDLKTDMLKALETYKQSLQKKEIVSGKEIKVLPAGTPNHIIYSWVEKGYRVEIEKDGVFSSVKLGICDEELELFYRKAI
jgi:hypothetical protein